MTCSKDSRVFHEPFCKVVCRKRIVRTGAVYIGRRGISRAWLAEATRLQAWTVGFPGPDLLLPPPAKCQTYILEKSSISADTLSCWPCCCWCMWMKMIPADAGGREGGRGACESGGETSNINSGEILSPQTGQLTSSSCPDFHFYILSISSLL